MEHYERAVILLIGLATAILGWWHSRRMGVAEAQKAVEEQRRILIELMEARLVEQGNLWKLRQEDIERRLRACEERWQHWQEGPVG